MSLDGHMILTTKGNEFFQAWLTFSEEEEQVHEDERILLLDLARGSQGYEGNVKLKKKSIFKTPTTESEYLNLVKTCKIIG